MRLFWGHDRMAQAIEWAARAPLPLARAPAA